MPNELMKQIRKERNKKVKKEQKIQSEWYRLRPILGFSPEYIFFLLVGGRQIGKSYAITDFFCNQFVNKGTPFYWCRLTEDSSAKLLKNNAEMLIDPDLRRKYDLDLITKGNRVYRVLKRGKKGKNGEIGTPIEKKLMATVVNLSTFYSDKGNGYFDKDWLKNNPQSYYNFCLDECQREKNERKTFSILYAFTNQLENLFRSTKTRIRVFCVCNLLEEASDLCCAFNFIPEKWGIYKIRKKRCVMHYIEPSDKYINRRRGTIADLLMPESSTFTNKINIDTALIDKSRLTSPKYIIKFSKDTTDWFVCWNNDIITKWTGQTKIQVMAMRPYLDEIFQIEVQKAMITAFDNRQFKYRDLITFKTFQKNMELLKPRK